MTMNDKAAAFKDIVNKMAELYEAKNSDYGDSFGSTFEKLGIISAVTRISDKFNRLVSLSTKPAKDIKVKDEKIEDTLMDLACYSVMTLIELQKEKQPIVSPMPDYVTDYIKPNIGLNK